MGVDVFMRVCAHTYMRTYTYTHKFTTKVNSIQRVCVCVCVCTIFFLGYCVVCYSLHVSIHMYTWVYVCLSKENQFSNIFTEQNNCWRSIVDLSASVNNNVNLKEISQLNWSICYSTGWADIPSKWNMYHPMSWRETAACGYRFCRAQDRSEKRKNIYI